VALRRKDLIGDDVDDLAGLMRRSPWYAVLMLVFLVSLAGIPPTAGFLAKYYIFLSLIETGHYYLAVVAVLYVAVAVYYYFRLVRVMFLDEAAGKQPALESSFGIKLSLAASGLATLAIGIFPEPVVRFAQTSLFK
jgi:NADH-quinone oxidoreductase subunit N